MDTASTTVIPTTTYAADVYTITVTPTGGAAMACAGAPATCPLVIGRNVVTITVTATDKLTRTYAAVVSRASDATLSSLELSATSYEPTFISTTLAYTAPVTLNEFVVSTFVTATTTYADDVDLRRRGQRRRRGGVQRDAGQLPVVRRAEHHHRDRHQPERRRAALHRRRRAGAVDQRLAVEPGAESRNLDAGLRHDHAWLHGKRAQQRGGCHRHRAHGISEPRSPSTVRRSFRAPPPA